MNDDDILVCSLTGIFGSFVFLFVFGVIMKILNVYWYPEYVVLPVIILSPLVLGLIFYLTESSEKMMQYE